MSFTRLLKFLIYLLAVTIFFRPLLMHAQNVYLPFCGKGIRTESEESPTLPQRTVRDNGTSVDVEYSFPGAFVASKRVGNISYNFLHIDGFSPMGEVGKPALPAHNDLVAIPDNAQAKISILETESKEYTGYMIHPTLKPARDTYGAPEPEFELDPETYNTDAYFPDRLVDIVEILKLRGIPFATVQIRPVQFNPVTQTIKVHSKIKYRIEFTGTNRSDMSKSTSDSLNSGNMLRRYVLNPNSIISIKDGVSPISDGIIGKDYIIITHWDYDAAAAELARWKSQSGYSVEVVSQPNWTATQVRDAIHSRYQNWIPKPRYFVIIGDHDDVPGEIHRDPIYGENFATDLYYACMDGSSDYVPDMAHGRISVSSTSEALSTVKKIIAYEETPVNDPAFYSSGLNCAMFQDDDPLDGYADRRFTHTSEEIREYIISQGYSVSRVYHTESYVTPTNFNNGFYSNGQVISSELLKSNGFEWRGDGLDVINNINAGKFYVFHRDHGYDDGRGWGRPEFTTHDIDYLTNENKLPVVFSINCLTGEFRRSECFAEKLLRKPGGGAVGVFAASYSSLSGWNDALSIGLVDAIWANPGLVPDFGSGGVSNPIVFPHSGIYTMGDVLNHALIRMLQTWNGGPKGNRYEHEVFHYFGDPAMKIWTASPSEITATHPDTLSVDSTSITISNSSCPDALATVYSNGELIGKTLLSDGSGTVTFAALTSNDPSVILTLSNHNYKPYIAVLGVGPSDVPVLSVTPSFQNVPETSGIVTFNVANTGAGSMYWTAAANDNWLRIINGSSGTNSGTITLEYDANSGSTADDRIGTITVTAVDAANSPETIEIRQIKADEAIKITASDGKADDWFGYDLSLSGDYAIVGTFFRGDAVYIYDYDGIGWKEQIKLTPEYANCWEVDISGDYAIVAFYRGVYVFKRSGDTWIEQEPRVEHDDDGTLSVEVAISGDYIIMGTRFDGSNVYFFQRDGDTWRQQPALSISAPPEYPNRQGECYSADISGDYAIVGTVWENPDDIHDDVYRADVFKREGNGWKYQVRLIPSVDDKRFGVSVGISGNYAIVGSWLTADATRKSGVAYIFERSADVWTEEAILTPLDDSRNTSFGLKSSISGDLAIVGAAFNNQAYIFYPTGNTWSQLTRLIPSDGKKNIQFGSAVAISDEHVLVGAKWDDEKGENSGSVYFYDNHFLQSIIPEPPGGLTIDLAYVISILKMLAGISSENISADDDISGDGKIGIEEVIYGLQVIADLRVASSIAKTSLVKEEIELMELKYLEKQEEFRRSERGLLKRQKREACSP